MVEELQVSQPSGQFKQLVLKKINKKIVWLSQRIGGCIEIGVLADLIEDKIRI